MSNDLHTDPGGLSGIHEDLLVKHLLGETTPGEYNRVETWLAADPANRHYYEHFRLIWRESRRLEDDSQQTDDQKEAAWQKFRQRIHRPASLQAVKDAPVTRQRTLPTWTRVAAILVLTASIGGLIYLTRQNVPPRDKNVFSNATVLTDTLPDGSLITLNKQSDISYPAKFNTRERTVRLQGEAFFKIAPDKEKPFKVYTNDVTITVLGTSFNVRDKGTTTEIIVETGLVRVTDAQHDILLHPSEKLILHKGDTTSSKDSTRSELYKYYRTKEFVCDSTPLWQLAQSLEEAYDVKIVIDNPSLRQLRINTVFRSQSLDQILDIIQETFRIRVKRSDGQIILQP